MLRKLNGEDWESALKNSIPKRKRQEEEPPIEETKIDEIESEEKNKLLI